MKSIIKNWLINTLGGITQEDAEKDMEEFRTGCEVFALKHLNPKGTSPVHREHPLTNIDTDENIILYVSKTSAVNCCSREIHVAPWAREVVLVGCKVKR